MLSDSQVVAVRSVLEKTYIGTCSIVERQTYKKPNMSTGFREVTVLEGQPCKLSFSTLKSTGDGDVATVTQITKLFIAPEIDIKAGSKIIVEQDEVITEYSRSAKPAVYNTHQEAVLNLFERWA